MKIYSAIKPEQYEKIQERLETLFEVLWVCTQYKETGRKHIFSVNERILINQERGALMSQLTAYDTEDDSQVREFELPSELEQKVQFIKSKL